MTNERRVLVHRDIHSLTGSVAARFITKMIDLLDEQAEAHVVLTGGGVGTGILKSINESEARDSVDWSRVHIWWGDERFVPRGNDDRNELGARSALLDHVGLLPEHIHPYPASDELDDLDAAAVSYAAQLESAAHDGERLPAFDITFLGVGPDGHIASLFPGSEAIRDTSDATVLPVRDSPKPPPERMTLTRSAINSSDRIWICLAGADKASALGLTLAGVGYVDVPAAGAIGKKRTVFFVDQEAAAEVPEDVIAQEY